MNDGTEGAESSGPDNEGGIPAGDASEIREPTALLSEVRSVKRQARLARHAYWFPLVLFGLLTCASIPFYLSPSCPPRDVNGCSFSSGPSSFITQSSFSSGPSSFITQSGYLGGTGGFIVQPGLAYYWLAALLLGLVGTVTWYRWHGQRVGLRTPARGFLFIGLGLVVLALVIPILIEHDPHNSALWNLMPGDLVIRGTFPFVIIAVGLCVLAWAERSLVLTVIATGYLALAVTASLYDIENVLFQLGVPFSTAVNDLTNVMLPALVLLLSGAGAWAVQRKRRLRVPAEQSAGG